LFNFQVPLSSMSGTKIGYMYWQEVSWSVIENAMRHKKLNVERRRVKMRCRPSKYVTLLNDATAQLKLAAWRRRARLVRGWVRVTVFGRVNHLRMEPGN